MEIWTVLTRGTDTDLRYRPKQIESLCLQLRSVLEMSRGFVTQPQQVFSHSR